MPENNNTNKQKIGIVLINKTIKGYVIIARADLKECGGGVAVFFICQGAGRKKYRKVKPR